MERKPIRRGGIKSAGYDRNNRVRQQIDAARGEAGLPPLAPAAVAHFARAEAERDG